MILSVGQLGQDKDVAGAGWDVPAIAAPSTTAPAVFVPVQTPTGTPPKTTPTPCQQKLIKGVCDWYLLAAAAGLIALTTIGGIGGRR